MIFVDTSGWIALVHRGDMLHSSAARIYKEIGMKKQVTTDAVLLETCNAFSHARMRRLAIVFMEQMDRCRASGIVEVIDTTGKAFRNGWEIFRTHLDKNWSLTDCISFSVMRERRIKGAFTSDHHFVQAGFEALVKE